MTETTVEREATMPSGARAGSGAADRWRIGAGARAALRSTRAVPRLRRERVTEGPPPLDGGVVPCRLDPRAKAKV
ncbi:hypothetical protein GCM10023335_61730 [Streptomyces siamensis]|uniref:Uncharacterized protein n=1 Tax=Streptomyces siamensis TaxID=1274986 RepID=A0ABP9JCS1_9ACTN